MLQDTNAWPHSEKDVRLSATSHGLKVAVADGRKFTIAAASGLSVPLDRTRLRITVSELGGGARWFVRLYGELRRAGDRRTTGVAENETRTGALLFNLDPRLRTLETPFQLQLGVEGTPGAFAVFSEVEFSPATPSANRLILKPNQPGQKAIAAVELMPNLPAPYVFTDWRKKARNYDRFVFDFKAMGEFLPLIWIDDSRINMNAPTFGLPSYVGTSDQAKGKRNSQEGITCMGAVLGATLVGIDKSRQEHDYVAMCEAWFNTANGMNLVLNRQQDGGGGSFWYELFPHIVFDALADRYPEKTRLTDIMRITAGRWREVCLDLAGTNKTPDFNHTSFNFRTRKPVDNGQWREPDAAAGVAWLQYAAWSRFGDSNYLDAAEDCLNFLQQQKDNPYYEVLLPYGALTAARINAELGRTYDVDRFLNWCFGISDCRGGWGVTVGNWGGYDCDGLLGSIDNRCGYAFAMNTFAQAGALTPIARYSPQYARAIGKWMRNLANSARLFYPGSLPPGHESSGFWKGDPGQVIAYEGLRYEWLGKSPCATGDPVAMNWGPKTDIGLYGSSYVGLLGAIVSQTSDPSIIQLDCLATDFFRPRAYPTYLYYNPHPRSRRIKIQVGNEPVSIYDAVSKTFVIKNVKGTVTLTLPSDGAMLAVITPAAGLMHHEGNKLLVNQVVVDYESNRVHQKP